jgi:hypothetical protein
MAKMSNVEAQNLGTLIRWITGAQRTGYIKERVSREEALGAAIYLDARMRGNDVIGTLGEQFIREHWPQEAR